MIWEDALEHETATPSNIFVWKIPWTEEPGRLQSMGSQKVGCFFFLFASLRDLSHPHMTTGKTIAFTRRTFVGKVMSPLFNMLSRLVITFLPRSKRLLISCFKMFN